MMLQKTTTENLEQSLSILDQLPLSVYVLDKQMRITYWNDHATEVSGFSRDDVLGRPCSSDILRHTLEDGASLCENGCPARACLDDGVCRDAPVYLHHKDGHRLLVDAKIIPVTGTDGQIEAVIHIAGLRSAMEKAMEQVRRLQQLTSTDVLTEQLNRKGLGEAVESWLSDFDRNGRTFAMCVIDINDFKQINDRLGHGVGDQVLQMIAKTLRNVCRSHDVVGRWGGDEFVALIVANDESEVDVVTERIRSLTAQSFLNVAGQRVAVTVSVGSAMVAPGDVPEGLFERADASLYEEKSRYHAVPA
jgi:diguanylate cyclase (GGDEF)-like protein/PAS domain S-box-containing protein